MPEQRTATASFVRGSHQRAGSTECTVYESHTHALMPDGRLGPILEDETVEESHAFADWAELHAEPSEWAERKGY